MCTPCHTALIQSASAKGRVGVRRIAVLDLEPQGAKGILALSSGYSRRRQDARLPNGFPLHPLLSPETGGLCTVIQVLLSPPFNSQDVRIFLFLLYFFLVETPSEACGRLCFPHRDLKSFRQGDAGGVSRPQVVEGSLGCPSHQERLM